MVKNKLKFSLLSGYRDLVDYWDIYLTGTTDIPASDASSKQLARTWLC